MPEWLDIVLKVAGALALILGPAAVWRGHVLARRTAQDAAAASAHALELQQATARLIADIEALKAGHATYQAIAEAQGKLVDATRLDLESERQQRTASNLREADCQVRLTNAEARLHALERHREARP